MLGIDETARLPQLNRFRRLPQKTLMPLRDFRNQQNWLTTVLRCVLRPLPVCALVYKDGPCGLVAAERLIPGMSRIYLNRGFTAC
jgi:hypothetical protein